MYKPLLRLRLIFSILIISIPAVAVYAPTPDLFTSPVLLINYKEWGAAYNKFNSSNSDTKAFKLLAEIIYDNDINRPWGVDYFPEANARLNTFREKICTGSSKFNICTEPKKVDNQNDLQILKDNIQKQNLITHLSNKWKLWVDTPIFPNTEPHFNFSVSEKGLTYTQSYSFWGFTQKSIVYNLNSIILLNDLSTYWAGFKSEEAPTFVAHSQRGYLLNDWLMRNRAMEFGQNWKQAIERNSQTTNKIDPVIDAALILQIQLFHESKRLFESTYSELRKLVSTDETTFKRFESEYSQKKYPLEVYQHIAYKFVKELIEIQSAYFSVTISDLDKLSMRQRTLESLLTLQKYSQFSTFIKLELATRSVVFSSSAVALDQIVDPMLTLTYGGEMINLSLQEGLYSNLKYFDKIKYALLQDEIFTAHFIKENFPAVWNEMKIDDSQIKSIHEFSPEKQLDLLRRVLKTPEGKTHIIGLIRMYNAFLTKVSKEDFKAMAEVVQKHRMQR